MSKVLAFFATILIFCATTHAKELSIEEVQQGVCRVTSMTNGGWFRKTDISMGSGTVYKETADKYYILTNGHVIGGGSSATVEFFRDGYKSVAIPAKIEYTVFRNGTSLDMSVISIDKHIFDKTPNKPRVIQIAPQAYQYKSKDKIYGAGCPNGRWCQLWFARINNVEPNTITFNMPPEGGQSGSGILTTIKDKNGENHTVLVGILSWRYGDDGASQYGGGIGLSRIYDIFKNDKPQPDRINASWKCASKISEVANGKCRLCGKSKEEHYVLWNKKTDSARKDASGQYVLFCEHELSDKSIVQPYETIVKFVDYTKWPGCDRPRPPQNPNPGPPSQEGPPNGGIWPDDSDNAPAPPNAPPSEDEPPTTPESPKEDSRVAELQKRIDSLIGQIKNLEGSNTGLDSQLKVLKNKMTELEAEKSKLEAESSTAKKTAAELESKVTSVVKEKTAIEKALEETKGKIQAVVAEKQEVELNLAHTSSSLDKSFKKNIELEAKVVNTSDELVAEKTEKQKVAEKLAKLTEEHKDQLNKVNIPYISENFGGLGEALSGLFAMLASGAFFTTLWHKFIYPQLVKRLGWFPTQIIGFVGKRKLRKYIDSQKKTSDETVSSGYNNNEAGDIIPDSKPAPELQPESTIELPEIPTKKVISNMSSISVVDIPVKQVNTAASTVSISDIEQKEVKSNNFPTQLFLQNNDTLLGFSPKEWAIKQGLYKQAVKLLREGRLLLPDKSQPLNWEKIGQIIEDYVEERFYTEVKLVDMTPTSNIRDVAYEGYLYYQAVQKLKRGEFNVLGYKEAADAVERYVRQQFMTKTR